MFQNAPSKNRCPRLAFGRAEFGDAYPGWVSSQTSFGFDRKFGVLNRQVMPWLVATARLDNRKGLLDSSERLLDY
jgi:hypothetical protein